MQTNANNLDAAIEQSHRALKGILKGNPKLYQDLFADRDDVTLGNPFGPFARGSAPVAATLAGAASYYRDREVVTIQLVANVIDNIRPKVGGSNASARRSNHDVTAGRVRDSVGPICSN